MFLLLIVPIVRGTRRFYLLLSEPFGVLAQRINSVFMIVIICFGAQRMCASTSFLRVFSLLKSYRWISY